MKNFLLLYFLFLLLSACGKKTTFKGRVYNPVTGEGISGIKVIVIKPKISLGYDGAGSKTVFETMTDEN